MKKATSRKAADKTTKAKVRQERIDLLTSQVEKLAECGVVLNCNFNAAKQISGWPDDYLETASYLPLLDFCGNHDVFSTETGPSGNENPTPNCLAFQYVAADEPYGEPEEYLDIVDRICRMTEGDLDVEVLSSELAVDDLGDEVVELKMKSGRKKRTGRYTYGLFDWLVFDDLAELLKGTKSKRVFFYLESGDLYRLYGCLSKPQYNKLKRLTGLKFKLV